ncbi:MAG: M28 family peptidase [Hyphomonas sp.]|uniref:M28 family peptidase n=1 Tax=Hyphomonas sp. TaxID=87 RepID=UPI0017E05251|nr:M28 family peptidase [Hyphomonas sp.]MBA3069828.1 M28 family peptidase [Hyphomonas sp.]MBU3922376.1 M28 family peptidase [Alphaproteobacteria bacterium]MBU4062669.1 M28 family peptidase [Alphaproteobacteria bacterium]MBU4164020.1 M28 family peptidase [Alphaproteobacteria bacterium]
MTQKRAFALAALLGFVAVCLGGFLLWQERQARDIPGVTYETRFIDPGPMLHLADVLSSDALEGRASGTPGNDAARGFIRKRFEDVGLLPFLPGGWEQPVTILPRPGLDNPGPGANLIGWVPGETPGTGPLIIVTAHYDHLGIRNGEIYNGADDNASGAAALTALAEYFVRQPPRHDILFVALDGEEVGFLGARALVRDPAVPIDRAALNINMDMVSRSDVGELYVTGTFHTPGLVPLVEQVAAKAPVTLRIGHDRPEDGVNDWTTQSDHALFHELGMPFLYLGVEDHPDYHKPTDDFSVIPLDFYVRAADTATSIVRAADANLPDIHALRRAPDETAQPEGHAE